MLKLRFYTSKFDKSVDAFRDGVLQVIDASTKEAAENIKNDTNYLDSDIPVIGGSTTVTKVNDGYEINKGGNLAHPELAAYSEFGTGDYAKVLLTGYPQEWKAMARKFFVNGKGRLRATPALFTAFNKNTVNLADKTAEKIGK